MVLGLIFIGVPLVIYLLVVIMPAGKASRILISAFGLCIAYIWVGYLLSWGPLWVGNDRADAYTFVAAVINSIAFVAGTVTATAGRALAARYAAVPYPAVVALILLITILPAFIVVGL